MNIDHNQSTQLFLNKLPIIYNWIRIPNLALAWCSFQSSALSSCWRKEIEGCVWVFLDSVITSVICINDDCYCHQEVLSELLRPGLYFFMIADMSTMSLHVSAATAQRSSDEREGESPGEARRFLKRFFFEARKIPLIVSRGILWCHLGKNFANPGWQKAQF